MYAKYIMYAKYKGQFYEAHIHKNDISLISDSKIENWNTKHGYWYKHIDISDKDLTDLYYDIYMVEYNDSIEEKTDWRVGILTPACTNTNPNNYEVIIDIDHFAKDDSWQNYDKYASYKIIKLQDCKRCYIQKVYQKRNGIICNDSLEEDLDIETFRDNLYNWN